MSLSDSPWLRDLHCVAFVLRKSRSSTTGATTSKLPGIAAAGRPMIAITARDGEIARLVREHSCGLVIEPGQTNTLAAALVQLSNDAPSLAAMGVRARAMLDARFTRRHAFDQWS